jgi:molybdenum cofactor biosynthesis protein B
MQKKQDAFIDIVEHKKDLHAKISFAVITVSDTRTKKDDLSGANIIAQIKKSGNDIAAYSIVKDDINLIQAEVRNLLDNNMIEMLVLNGGTGISKKDVTIEAVKPLFEKELSAFSVLFAKLSYNEIGSSAILSRAVAGIINGRAVFLIPGSPKACKLAMENIIIPEFGHIIKHLHE